MAITSTVNQDYSELTISVDGRFDFTLHKEFRDTYTNSNLSSNISKYIIDMGNTNYMDSSALGMLLLLREYAGGESSDISIVNCNSEIKEILEISNFDRLFKIG